MKAPKIGLQLCTVRDYAEKDFMGTLRAITQMGYSGVEFCGYFNASVSQIRELLDETGLLIAGSIAAPFQILDQPDDHLVFSHQIGCPAMINPSIPNENSNEPDMWPDLARWLNELGQRCSEYGMKFYHHIHGNEFFSYKGTMLIDILLDQTDPALVSFLPDTYWIEKAGIDSLSFIEQHHKRVHNIHVKDARDTDEWFDTEAGNGVLPISDIVQLGMEKAVPWLIVEQEKFTQSSMISAEKSCKNIQQSIMLESSIH